MRQSAAKLYNFYLCLCLCYMTGFIYKITSPSGKCYIGQTIDLKARKRCFYNPNKYYSGGKIQNAIRKYGAENKEDLRKKLDLLECFYIKKFDSYKNGYNMTQGGSGTKGCFQTEESRKKISEKAKGRIGTMTGKHLTEEQRKKVSDFAKTRTGNKNAFYGKHHSQKTKNAIAKANGKPVIQMDLNGNFIAEFISAREAAKCLGKPKANSEILKVCNKYVSPSNRHYITALGYK